MSSPTVDPAWFYTAVAQVSAAIVGLVGAFLGARLIDQYSKNLEERRKVNGRIVYTLDQINNAWAWTKELSKFVDHVETKIALGEKFPMFSNYNVTWTGSSSGGNRVIEGWQSLEILRSDKVVIDQLADLFKRPSGIVDIVHLKTLTRQIQELAEVAKGEGGTGRINGWAEIIDGLVADTEQFKINALPKSFFFLPFLLLWLTITGVIWPLAMLESFSILPAQQWILGAVGLGSIGIIVVFIFQTISAWRLTKLKWEVHLQGYDPL